MLGLQSPETGVSTDPYIDGLKPLGTSVVERKNKAGAFFNAVVRNHPDDGKDRVPNSHTSFISMKEAYNLMNMPGSASAYFDINSPSTGKRTEAHPEILFIGEDQSSEKAHHDLLEQYLHQPSS